MPQLSRRIQSERYAAPLPATCNVPDKGLNFPPPLSLKQSAKDISCDRPRLTHRTLAVDTFDQTIISFELANLEGPASPGTNAGFSDIVIESKTFNIRFAQHSDTLTSASMLVQKRYAWRGFPKIQLKKHPNRVNIVASTGDEIVGNLMVGYDSEEGLLGDEIYKPEIDVLRKRGRKVGELSKLAMDEKYGSKQLLASMIHIAYLYGLIHECTDSIIEIVPHHKKYYEKMLGFSQIGEEKINPRVNSPVVLMHLDLSNMEQKIRKIGGMGKAAKDRSLYPYFFSARDQEGILHRLLRVEE